MDAPSRPDQPLRQIGIAMSGGGFRAAGFHLGVLDLLDELGLLSNVTMLSTVSGGTFVGAGYAWALARGRPFSEFRDDFSAALADSHPIRDALAILNDSRRASRLPRPTLIAAAAQVYGGLFFGRSGSAARLGEILDAQCHLQEVVFNATDFSGGLPFRFQKSRNPRARIGNFENTVPRSVAAEVRLADIVAASSCFPAAFEPMAFPDDFVWCQPEAVFRRLQRQGFTMPLPLMDGGIADNQGMESLLLADERSDQRLDLIVISDANRPPDQRLLAIPERFHQGRVRVAHVFWFLALFTAAATMAVGLHAARLVWLLYRGALVGRVPWFELVSLCLAAGLLTAVTLAMLWFWRSLHELVLSRLPDVGIDIPASIRPLRVAHLADLLLLRASSLKTMASEVFMKRIRGGIYKQAFSHPRYQDKLAPCLIYQLADAKGSDGLAPSPPMRDLARRVSRMPTVLWFEHADQLSELIACGRCTACYMLLRYFQDIYGEDPDRYPAAVKTLAARARQRWLRLCRDPLCERAAGSG